MKKTKELIPSESTSVEDLIARAIDKGTPVETMEKILAMGREVRAEQARIEFDKSMAEFQGECPTIKKTKRGGQTKSGQVAYYYAPIEAIVEQTKGIIKKHGFSYLIKTEVTEKGVKVKCIVKHELGHSESSEMEVPLGQGTNVMSAPQITAAATTFAKRYAFCNAFGIMTGDEDNDARTENQKPVQQVAMITKMQMEKICELLKEVNMPLAKLEKQLGRPIQELTFAGAVAVINQLKSAASKSETKEGEVIVVCESCGNEMESAEVDYCDNTDEDIEIAGKKVKYICGKCREELFGEKKDE